MNKSLAEGGTLLHAARQFVRIAISEIIELDRADQSIDGRTVLGDRQAAQFDLQFNIAAHGAPGDQGIVLEHDADAGLGRRDDMAADIDLTRRTIEEAGDHQHQGGLTAARGADQRNELAGLHAQARRAESMNRLDARSIGLGQVRDGDDRRHRRDLTCRATGRSPSLGEP